jgi:hypothetical protein
MVITPYLFRWRDGFFGRCTYSRGYDHVGVFGTGHCTLHHDQTTLNINTRHFEVLHRSSDIA